MEPGEYLRIFRRYWVVVAAAVLLAVAVAWFVRPVDSSERPETSYEATVALLKTTVGFQGPTGLDNTTTVAALVTLSPIPERVKEELGYPGSADDLVGKVTSRVHEQSDILSIVVTSTDEAEARALADTFANVLLERLKELRAEERRRDLRVLKEQIDALENEVEETDPQTEAGRTVSAQLAVLLGRYEELKTAPEPGYQIVSPVSVHEVTSNGLQAPRSLAVRALIAVVLGLLGGGGIALLLGLFDTRIRTKESAEEQFALPVLAEIPVIARRDRAAIVAAARPTSAPAEAFRLLGAELARGVAPDDGGNGDGKEGPCLLLVTSAGPAEGKTTVVANLAVTLAEMGRRVLVVSCDFRHPNIHMLFDVPNHKGLADTLMSDNGEVGLANCLSDTMYKGIRVLPSGTPPRPPGELLSSGNMGRVLQEARQAADIVLIDSAAILAVTDAAHLVPDVDAVLVVARMGKTTRRVAGRTTELLRRLRAPVIGVALNGASGIVHPRGYRRYHTSVVPASEPEDVGDFPNLPVPLARDNL